MEKIRTSRESSTRAKEVRKVDWAPSSSLDAPPAPKGFAHRWIRTTVQGFDDTSNVSRKLREGWEFVRADTIVSELGKNDCLLYTSPSPRDATLSRMPSSA